MSLRLSLALLLLFSLCTGVRAQQLPRYSMPYQDVVQFNPAYAGLDNSLSVTGTYRTQWTGLEGQPVGQRLSLHLPIYFLSSGFGFEVERDQLGARRLSSAAASYNYQLVRGKSVWSLGVNAKYVQLGLDGGQLRTPGGLYEQGNVNVHNDALLLTGDVSEGGLSLGAGLYYQTESLEGGVSARNLNRPVIGFSGLDYTLGRQYHAYLRARFDLPADLEALPHAYAISDGTQTQIMAGANVRYRENLFLGGSWRSGGNGQSDAIIISGGLDLSETIKVSYAYDLTVSGLQTVQDGSHEITLKYNLGKRIGAGVPPPVIFFPRTKE